MNSKKQYLFVTNQFKTGGVETVFYNISKKIDVNILLFPVHLNLNKDLIRRLPHNVKLLKNKYRIKRNVVSFIKIISMSFRYRKEYRNDNTKIINFSDTLTTLLFSYLLNPKNVVSWVHCNPEALLKAKTHSIYWWLLKKCRKIIFVSEAQRNLFLSMPESEGIERAKTVVCTNFIDTDFIEKSRQEPLRTQNFLFTASRLDLRSKDYLTLIEAYSLLPIETRQKYRLLIAGDGPDKLKIQRKIEEKNLRDRIILLGNVNNPFTYMSKCKVFIHASISEGFAMSILEALACGATVVASDCHVGPSGILDNGKYGYLYTPGDVNMLSQKICKALGHGIPTNIAQKRANEITKLGICQVKEYLENGE